MSQDQPNKPSQDQPNPPGPSHLAGLAVAALMSSSTACTNKAAPVTDTPTTTQPAPDVQPVAESTSDGHDADERGEDGIDTSVAEDGDGEWDNQGGSRG